MSDFCSSVTSPSERTLALVKSGAVDRGQHNAIVDMALGINGLELVAMKRMWLSREHIETLCGSLRGSHHYGHMVTSISGARGVFALVLEGANAVRLWCDLMGPTNPLLARQASPRTIRALFGGDETWDNAVYGSDTVARATQEISSLFPGMFPEVPHNVSLAEIEFSVCH